LAKAHHRLREYGAELEVARQAPRRFPGSLELRTREAAALVALGRQDEAEGILDAATAIPAQMGGFGMLLVMSAVELRAHGHLEDATRLAERAAAWCAARSTAEQPAYRPFHVLALFLAGRWREAKTVATALGDSRAPVWDYITLFWGQPAVYRLGWIGSCAARAGDVAEARRVGAQLRDFPSSCPPYDRTYWRAIIAAQLGAKDEAMRLFEEAVAQESLMVWQADHDALLEPLWNEPRFRALVRPWEQR
jgi:tetratricopeptide (TPR) repeat protein